MTRRRVARIAAVAGFAAIVAACVPVTQPPPPAGPPPPPLPPQLAAVPPTVPLPASSPTLLVDQNFVTGLNKPWDIAFVPGATGPDGKMLYTENDAKTVRVYSATPGADPIILTEAAVNTGGEGGMMGIAVHPSWPTSPYVYVCYTTVSDNRVVRYTATLDGAGVPTTLTSPMNIVTGMLFSGFHNGCRIRFQPGTGVLYVTMGDAGVGPAPQDPNGLNGKILRVNADGSVPAANASGKRWFTRGHRNPQGLAFDPADNVAWTAEHGPNKNDEVNRLANGATSGWDPNTGGAYDQGHAMTDLAKFPTAMQPRWRSGDGFTIAPSGMTFLQNVGGQDWKSWNNNIVIAVLKNQELRMLTLNGTRGVTGQVQVYSAPDRLRVPVLGPDGMLYVTTDENPGRIYRIDPS